MSELTVSSTNWLAISLRNGAAIIFNLNNVEQWQYIQSTTPSSTATNNKQTVDEDDDDNANGLNRNLIKFTPNGRKLAINGQNKQIYIYILSYDESNKTYWQLQRIITVKKRASAIDLTNNSLVIADKSGDVYQTDLSSNTNLVLTHDDCLMGHLSMLLDIVFIDGIDNQQYLLTADRDEKIRLTHYPNSYNIQGFCLGHTEFVLYVKLIDQNHLLSASGDGTLRLWQIPDCIELNVFHTKTLISSSKEIFYGATSNIEDVDSSSIDTSIWKMEVLNSSTILIALSTYASRSHSIYLTTLSNLKDSNNNHHKLTFSTSYGPIIDYCLSSSMDLYVIFDSNLLLKININADKNEFLEENLMKINEILSLKDNNLIPNTNSKEIIFKQLFKIRNNPEENSYYKRKNQRIEQQEEKRRKKQVNTLDQSPQE